MYAHVPGSLSKISVCFVVSDDRRITSLNGSVLSLHLGGLVHEYYINAGEFHWLNVTNHVKYECCCCEQRKKKNH